MAIKKMTVFVKAEYLIDYTFQMTDNTNRYGKKHRLNIENKPIVWYN